jgi:hypothetical protein
MGPSAFIVKLSLDCEDSRQFGLFWSRVTGYQPAMGRDDFVTYFVVGVVVPVTALTGDVDSGAVRH